MKIYTGSGDRGMTSLFNRERVKKSFERGKVYGDVDELNSVLGALAAALPADSSGITDEIQHIRFLHQGSQRDYSLVSGPDNETLSLCIRYVESGAFSPTLAAARSGSQFHFSGPHGYFLFQPSRSYDFYLCGRSEMIRDVTLLIDDRFQGSLVYTEMLY